MIYTLISSSIAINFAAETDNLFDGKDDFEDDKNFHDEIVPLALKDYLDLNFAYIFDLIKYI
ncbi:12626_t:CDS:2 [Rhizophagus irregularis]|nr:12626_t:CDS:2 [Rhizophagus irregularis]